MRTLKDFFDRARDFQYRYRNPDEFRKAYLGKLVDDLINESCQGPNAFEQMVKKFTVACFVFGWKAIVRYDENDLITEIVGVRV